MRVARLALERLDPVEAGDPLVELARTGGRVLGQLVELNERDCGKHV